MVSFRSVLCLLAPVLGVAVVAACSSSNQETKDEKVCTPGAYVYCRCEDRSEGTKLCKADGRSFDECKCDGSNPGPTEEGDGGFGSGPLEPVEAGTPPPGAPALDAKCIGKVGVVAGAEDSSDAYVAAYAGKGVFNVSKSTGPGVRGPVTILPAYGSLVATYASRYTLIAWTKMTAGTWSPPVSVGSASTSSATSATLLGTDIRLFYPSMDGALRMGTYRSSGWDDATALAGTTADAGVPDRSPPAAAAKGSTVTVAFTGGDGSLDRETYSSGSFSSITKMTASAYNVPPAIVGLDGSGTKDMLMVYVGQDLVLHASSRSASNKAWSAPAIVDDAAISIEMNLVPLPNGGALLTYLGSNDEPYVSTWDPSTGKFSPPAELIPGNNPVLASAPSLVRGACNGDVLVAYAEKKGGVSILSYANGKSSGPYAVTGIPAASWVGVGELP